MKSLKNEELSASERSALDEMSRALAICQSAPDIARFFESILTNAELHELAKRWLLVQDLEAGIPQRRIAAVHHLSLCKITRGSKELKRPDSPIRSMMRLVNEESEGTPG